MAGLQNKNMYSILVKINKNEILTKLKKTMGWLGFKLERDTEWVLFSVIIFNIGIKIYKKL